MLSLLIVIYGWNWLEGFSEAHDHDLSQTATSISEARNKQPCHT